MKAAILRKLKGSAKILSAIGFPLGKGEFRSQLRQDRVCLILLAVSDLRPSDSWSSAKYHSDGLKHAPRTRDIIQFLNENYGTKISSGSYDDIKRKNLDYLVEAGLVVPSAARKEASTNDGTRGYAISDDAANLIRSYGTAAWSDAVAAFVASHCSLDVALHRPSAAPMVVVRFPDDRIVQLSAGPHNEIQKAIIEEFLPRFLKDPRILYLGDTAKKTLVRDDKVLGELGLALSEHDRLPDIVALDQERGWIFLIEAVHSSNPVSRLRHIDLERLTSGCKRGKVYVSAFKNLNSFAKWAKDISWETEIWVADNPAHMIHYNGDRFFGPRDA